MIALLVITEGRRDCLEQTIHSARARLHGDITRRFIYDDSGDIEHRRWLHDRFPEFQVIFHPYGRQGFGGAIRCAWDHLRTCYEPFIFHLENDFTFNEHIDLDDLAALLGRRPNIVQVALLRQPWNETEIAAGGLIAANQDAYHEHADEHARWVEHRRFFTTNPCIYRRELIQTHDWPEGPQSEGRFGLGLFNADPDAVSAFWGGLHDPPTVHHIGHVRAGHGY